MPSSSSSSLFAVPPHHHPQPPPTVMGVEIRVAQNFVLNFLYNKLPRRRVNLFGEELELALLDKFADHWYPDQPFKGSAYRCLRITDPSDPVLNRAARESGNPLPDIVENLPMDLAIWIDPGEVSYRVGEKGSVKILYTENGPGSPGVSPVGPSASGLRALHASSSNSSGASDELNLNAEVAGYNMPTLDNLTSALGGLSVGPPPAPPPPPLPSSSLAPSAPPPPPPPPPSANNSASIAVAAAAAAAAVAGGHHSGGGAPGSSSNGFSPFQPRQQPQTLTYTAGTFAQTKFGSTKLKTNGKKTNRMSPTEFSNYIKQRALQKQNSVGNNGFSGMRPPPMNNGFRPLQHQMSANGAMSNGYGNGFHSSMSGSNSNMGFSLQQQQQQQHQQQRGGGFLQQQMSNGSSNNGSSDPFFFPLLPDRSGCNNSFGSPSSSSSSSSVNGSSSFHGLNNFASSFPHQQQQPPQQSRQNGGGNVWSGMSGENHADVSDSFLHDLLSVGIQQQQQQQQPLTSKRSLGAFDLPSSSSSSSASSSSNSSDFGPGGLAGGLFADRFGSGNSGGLNLGGGGGNSNQDELGIAGLLSGRGGLGGLLGNDMGHNPSSNGLGGLSEGLLGSCPLGGLDAQHNTLSPSGSNGAIGQSPSAANGGHHFPPASAQASSASSRMLVAN